MALRRGAVGGAAGVRGLEGLSDGTCADGFGGAGAAAGDAGEGDRRESESAPFGTISERGKEFAEQKTERRSIPKLLDALFLSFFLFTDTKQDIQNC